LWTVLDEAHCGTPVGVEDFNLRGRGDQPEQQTTLAVDLSIWICEGITSTALSSFHSDPALHLVYQRTIKLLKLGLGLVFVVEGARRGGVIQSQQTASSSSAQTHELKQRRSGSQFWNASQRCETMLQCLGVPVVRAEAEGEALCALLNEKGLVDGVISNDGDCLLFGATTIYTGFSAENLKARKVVRYDAATLVANLDGNGIGNNRSSRRTIKLSREDLIAFAVLTGSDLVGSGVSHVGHRKAIQFLHACKSVKHPYNDRTCLDELLSWGDVAANPTKDLCIDCDDDGPSTIPSRCCSLCLHSGNKLRHKENGCVECGTGPGEGCFVVTSSEKFLRSIKEKAIGLIAPRNIVNEYFTPNNNNVPNSLKVKPLASPKKLFTTSLILKGRSPDTSQDYIKQTLPKLLVRLDILETGPRNRYATRQRYKPIPVRIEKKLVKQSWPCYEITWTINIHPTSEDEQFQFGTVESQSLINVSFPQLVKAFHQEERRRQQGLVEDDRRKRFVGTKDNHAQKRNQNQRRDFSKKLHQAGHRRKRERNFDVERVKKVAKTAAVSSAGENEDVSMLMNDLQFDGPIQSNDELESALFDTGMEEHSQFFAHDSLKDTNYMEIEQSRDVTDNDKSDHSAPINCGLETYTESDEESESSRDCSQDEIQDNHRSCNERRKKDVCEDAGPGDYCLRPTNLFQQGVQDHALDYGVLDNLSACRLETCRDMPDATHQQSTFCGAGSWNEERELSDTADGIGYGSDDHLCSYGRNQVHEGAHQGIQVQAQHLSPSNRLFCDMGTFHIEVTPLISRRWRFF
ncbi:hypothetical protein ACHAXR_007988, partial [Thalassiosira sp. AJA248-18]